MHIHVNMNLKLSMIILFWNILQRNSFQCIIATNEVDTFVIFIYDDIQWTTGKESNGRPDTGIGGTPAQVSVPSPLKTSNECIPVIHSSLFLLNTQFLDLSWSIH